MCIMTEVSGTIVNYSVVTRDELERKSELICIVI